MERTGTGVNHPFNGGARRRTGNGIGTKGIDGGLNGNVGHRKGGTLYTCRNADLQNFFALFPVNPQKFPIQPVTGARGGKNTQNEDCGKRVTEEGGNGM